MSLSHINSPVDAQYTNRTKLQTWLAKEYKIQTLLFLLNSPCSVISFTHHFSKVAFIPLLSVHTIHLVKNCEGSEISSIYNCTRIACHSFVDVGKDKSFLT